jgi:hypothetical protein
VFLLPQQYSLYVYMLVETKIFSPKYVIYVDFKAVLLKHTLLLITVFLSIAIKFSMSVAKLGSEKRKA